MAERKAKEEKFAVNVRFIFNYCNDLAAMRRFYSQLVGLKEKDYREEWGYLCYASEGLEFMFFRSDKEMPHIDEWSDQPGWEGGTLKITSWAIHIPEMMFKDVFERLHSAGVKMLTDSPEWRVDNYWGITVMDPMGYTVELYTIPKEKPASKLWKG